MSAAGAILAAALAAALPPPETWILSCDIPRVGDSASARTAPRVFKLGPKLFQEWKADTNRFGTNLCEAFTCAADRDQLTGTLTSASVILTVTMNPAAGAGGWMTTGATNLSRTHGRCTAKPEKAG
jgi:hypothetical protein